MLHGYPPPFLPARPKATPSESTPRSVVCGAFPCKPLVKFACVSQPIPLVNASTLEGKNKGQAGQQAAPFERGKSRGVTQHEGDSSQRHLVFAYSSSALHTAFHEQYEQVIAHIELGVAAALQAIQHAMGFLQMLLSSAAQRVGLMPSPQAAQATHLTAANQLGTLGQVPQHAQAQTRLQVQQRPEHQHSKPHAVAPLAHITTPSGSGAASSANMYTTAAQQRIATVAQGVQQSPAFAAACSLSPLQRVAGAVLLLLAVLGPQIMLFKARRRAAEAEAEKQRQASALSLKLQKQRFRAALAFDAVHLELPGIKESDVDPSDLVAKVAGTSQGHPMELEGAIRKEWLQFMSASKVGLVTDLWDAKSKDCNDNGPAASRAELEEMTRRVREANSIKGSSRHRSISEERRAAAEAADDDGWFLTKEDGGGMTRPGPSSSHACGRDKEAQEVQIDMESMEERAARRRARMADQFASDEDVASMWTERRVGRAASRPRPPLHPPPKAMPDLHSARSGTPTAGRSSTSPSLRRVPESTHGTSIPVPNHEQQQQRRRKQQQVPLDPPSSRSRGSLGIHSTSARVQDEVNPNPASSHRAGGPHTKRLLRAQPLPPGTLPDSVFGAAVQPWQLPVASRPEGSLYKLPEVSFHTLLPQSADMPRQHTLMHHVGSNKAGGIALDTMGWSDDASVGFDTEQSPVSQNVGGSHNVGSGRSSGSSSSSSAPHSVHMGGGGNRNSRASSSEGVSNTLEPPEWGGMRTPLRAEEDAHVLATAGQWVRQGHGGLSRAAAWQQGGLSSIGYLRDEAAGGHLSHEAAGGHLSHEAAGQLEAHMKQDAVLFVASPEHTSPLLAARSRALSSSSSETGVPSQSSTSSCETPLSCPGIQTVPPAAESTSTPVPSVIDAPVAAATPESSAMQRQAGLQEGMCADKGRTTSCSSTGKGDSASPGAEKVEKQEIQGQQERAGSAADAEARLARFMRRPTSHTHKDDE